MYKPKELLKKYWGFDEFRPLQKEIINQVLHKEDVIALLPTGGGKSLCFQIPALINPGICIVVSPLVALMEDQVKALQSKQIRAMAISGGTPFKEVDTLLDNCIYGGYKFLYLSPERLQQELVQERIKLMQVNLIAVDEAHCISQWGHDFRPAYRNIALLRQLKPHVNMIALTATATLPVVQDIAQQLELEKVKILRMSFLRKNLAYRVEETQDKLQLLEQLVREDQDPVIIYVRTRKATLELEKFLTLQGFSTAAFHGGLTREEKSKRLSQWLKEQKRIMVATSAFGMGIDKANVRTVVHFDLPESLESYFQEAGRAGRNGAPSRSVILTHKADIPLLKNQFLSTLPSVDLVRMVYKKLNSYFRIAYGEGEGEVFDLNFYKFCKAYQFNTLQAFNAVQLLDRASILSFTENFQKKTTIQFLSSGAQLDHYLRANPRFSPVINAIRRNFGGSFEGKVDIPLNIIADKAGTGVQEVVTRLGQLHREEILLFEQDQQDTRITFLVPREDAISINPIVPFIQAQEQSKKKKIQQVLDYITNDKVCKSEQLLSYFGETETEACGFCSVCQPSFTQVGTPDLKKMKFALIAYLETGPSSFSELCKELPLKETEVRNILKLLLEEKVVDRDAEGNFKLKYQ